jgi:hypothetical protein
MFFLGARRNYPLTTSSDCAIPNPLILGRSQRYEIPGLSGGWHVRVGREVQSCVVFIGFSDPRSLTGFDCQGTGFLLFHDGGAYLITARHVAETVDGSPFAIRVNHAGKAVPLEQDCAEWHYHPDDTVDVAATPLVLPAGAGFAAKYIHPDIILSEDAIKAGETFDVGDFCYTVGLFKYIYGDKQNIPFVHVGHLAVVPPQGERIPVYNRLKQRTDRVEAYLIECNAIDGASGSPVFLRTAVGWGPIHTKSGNAKTVQLVEDKIRLLGVFLGAWFEPPDETRSKAIQTPRKGGVVPVGVGVVVPTSKIFEVLDMPKLKSDRDKAKQSGAARQASADEHDGAPAATDENPTHREDFSRLLGEAARKREQED